MSSILENMLQDKWT